METAFQADAFQFDTLAFQIIVTAPVEDTTAPRTAAGGPTGGAKHRKRYIFPSREQLEEQEREALAEALGAPVQIIEEEDDSEMLDVIAAFMANEDLF